jgi:hypothetical protein
MARAPALALVALLALPAAALPLAAGLEPAPALLLPDPAGVLEPVRGLLPEPPGTVLSTAMLYGPFAVPPGWDLTRVSLDVRLNTGFVTSLAYRLVDPVTGAEPDAMDAHIHHALWFKAAQETGDFLFGTGEERTRLDFDARSAAQPDGPHYGLSTDRGQPSVLVLMLHNKTPNTRVLSIMLDVTFVFGTAWQIRHAETCRPPLLGGGGCAAGAVFHDVSGQLFGAVFDVPREAGGDGVFVYPTDATEPPFTPALPAAPFTTSFERYQDILTGGRILDLTWVADANATAIHAAGHVHPNGLATVLVNLGPAGSGCEADLDADGFPGTTLLRSDKLDRVPGVHASEEYQMGVTQPGWRAPVRLGDRISQLGLYANRDAATYGAMTFVAFHYDRAQAPPPRTGPCDTAPVLLAGGGDPAAGVPNRAFQGAPMPVCGVPGQPACDRPWTDRGPGLEVPAVTIADFTYAPGDQHLVGQLGAPARVHEGQALQFVNLDGAAVVRHSVTSCRWPCNGPYVANYPVADGTFDSGLMGNVDLSDRGSVPPDEGDDVLWASPAGLAAGMYSYYCRIHPWMRGAFEVVP